MKKLPLHLSESISINAFDIIHSDIWGPTTTSIDGYKYFLTLVDDCTSFTWAIMMRLKGEATDLIK